VLVARDRVREGGHLVLGHAVDDDPGALAVDRDVQRRALDRCRLVEGRVEDLEEAVALLPAPDPRERLVLLVARVDVGVAPGPPVVDLAPPTTRPSEPPHR